LIRIIPFFDVAVMIKIFANVSSSKPIF